MSGIGGGDTVVASQQVYYDNLMPQIQNVIPNKTVTAKLFEAKAKSYGGNSSTDSRKLGQFSYSLPSSLTNARQVFLNDHNTNTQPSHRRFFRECEWCRDNEVQSSDDDK